MHFAKYFLQLQQIKRDMFLRDFMKVLVSVSVLSLSGNLFHKIQQCSIENPKGDIAIDFVQG